MADRARFELFNDRRLIPPGIGDARSEAVLAAFAHGAALFDVEKLLMRRGDEMPDEALPLAIHERSLGEYIPAYGLPAGVVRGLVDGSFAIHARQGTDGGVSFALALIGARARFDHWWQQQPQGQPNTHKVTVYANRPVFDDEPVLLDEKTTGALVRSIDATRRWSQHASFVIGAGFDRNVAVAERAAAMVVARPRASIRPDTRRANRLLAANRAAALVVTRRMVGARPATRPASTPIAASRAAAAQVQRATFTAA